jgi:REP element-mobilizing transposase RayT
MARPRKRHVQQLLFRHGGVRKGAGRPPKSPGRPGAPHKRRPTLKASEPVHVVLRVVAAIRTMRQRAMYRALREATLTVARRELAYADSRAFRIVHVSIQRTHVHLLVEAANRTALSRGMQSFQISAARHINRAAGARRPGASIRSRPASCSPAGAKISIAPRSGDGAPPTIRSSSTSLEPGCFERAGAEQGP